MAADGEAVEGRPRRETRWDWADLPRRIVILSEALVPKREGFREPKFEGAVTSYFFIFVKDMRKASCDGRHSKIFPLIFLA